MLDLLRRNPEDRENLDHDLDKYIHHLCRWWHLCVNLNTSEKHFDALEHVDKGVLSCSGMHSCLRDVGVTVARTELLRRLHTDSRTPKPAKITLADGNTCQMDVSADLRQSHVLTHTRPTPSPRVAERLKRTFTVGSSHRVHRSSRIRDWSSP